MAPPAQLEKTPVSAGNGTDFPKPGDDVTIAYTGWLYKEGNEKNRGDQYVSLIRLKCSEQRLNQII